MPRIIDDDEEEDSSALSELEVSSDNMAEHEAEEEEDEHEEEEEEEDDEVEEEEEEEVEEEEEENESLSGMDEEDEESDDYEEARPAPKLVLKFDRRKEPVKPKRVEEIKSKATSRRKVVSDESEEGTPIGEVGGDLEMDEEDEVGYDDDDDEGAATPDITKMTARQRARFVSETPDELVELTDEPIRKKVLTEEAEQLRRAEMARRRKNLSERRLEEEKQDTLDKLLKKRAPKNRKAANDDTSALDDEGSAQPIKRSRLIPPHPAMTSWVSSRDQSTLSVPPEWDGKESLALASVVTWL
jgi:Ino eighty subunit 2